MKTARLITDCGGAFVRGNGDNKTKGITMGYELQDGRLSLDNGDEYTPNKYQLAVIEHVLNERGDIVVNAVAGSGKSTTLKMLAGIIDTGIQLAAFNRSIRDELSHSLYDFRHVSVTTIHGAGFAGVRSAFPGVSVANGLYRKEAIGILKSEDHRNPYGLASDVAKVWDRVRVSMINPLEDPHLIGAVIRELDIDISDDDSAWLHSHIRRLYRRGIDHHYRPREVDFCDMLWLCANRLECKPRPFSWVLVDECQDLSPAQLAVMLRVRMTGGRMVFVGDRNQAIYGFAGASTRSIDTIIEKTEAIELPLSVCYRCPFTHLRIARTIVPHIEAAPGAKAGTVNKLARSALAESVKDGDIILCRLTAPLISLCFDLIKKGIAARVRGRDIGKSLSGMVRDVARKIPRNVTFGDGFLEALDNHSRKAIQKYLNETDGDEEDPRIITVRDKAAAVITLFDVEDSESSLCHRIEDLFSDERTSVWLSTVHRAKGLEAERVMILNPSRIRLTLTDPEAAQQEANLEYVALTRSKDTLTFITSNDADEIAADTYIGVATIEPELEMMYEHEDPCAFGHE